MIATLRRMEMRVSYLFLMLLLSIAGFSQKLDKTAKKELKSAFTSIDYEDYIDASDRLSDLYKRYPNDDEVRFGFAICKLNQKGNERDALELIENVFDTKDLENYYYYLGRAYLPHGKFEDAINAFQTILLDKHKSVGEEDIVNYMSIAYEARELMTAKRKVEVNNLGPVVNSKFQESVPVFLPNHRGLFYTSRREDNVSDQRDHLGRFFQDIYFSALKDDQWQRPVNCATINDKLHDAAVSISHDGSQFLYFKTNPDNVVQGDLYLADCDENGTLSNSRMLPEGVNSKYIESSASLSADGNTIFFSSNRPGGYGGFDLYYAKRLPTGAWGKEVNMGPMINTAGNEDAPYFHLDNRTLYFSSDGKLGLGGYDIYSCKLNKDQSWSQPVNVGYPINSLAHDLYFRLSENEQQAFLSSDREEGLGGDDIYLVNIYDHESFKTVIKGNVSDLNNNPLKAKITIINELDKNLNGIYRTNSRGNFILLTMPLDSYQMIVEAEGYETQTLQMNFEELKAKEVLELKLRSKETPSAKIDL